MPYNPTIYTTKAALLSSVEDRVYQNTTQLVTGEIHQQVEMDEVASMWRTAAAPLTLDTATGVMGLTAGLVAGNTYQWDGTAWGQVQTKTANIYWVDSVYGLDATAQVSNPFRAWQTFTAAAAAASDSNGTIQIRGSGSYAVSSTSIRNVTVYGPTATLVGDIVLSGAAVDVRIKQVTGNVSTTAGANALMTGTDVTGGMNSLGTDSILTFKRGTIGGSVVCGQAYFFAENATITEFVAAGSPGALKRNASFKNCTIGSRSNSGAAIRAATSSNPGKDVLLSFCTLLSSGASAVTANTPSSLLVITSDNSIAIPNVIQGWDIVSNYQRIGEP